MLRPTKRSVLSPYVLPPYIESLLGTAESEDGIFAREIVEDAIVFYVQNLSSVSRQEYHALQIVVHAGNYVPDLDEEPDLFTDLEVPVE